jgi:hypothetical protein
VFIVANAGNIEENPPLPATLAQLPVNPRAVARIHQD